MSDPTARVRVTGPDRRPRPRRPAGDIDEETPLGGVYLSSLLRDQLFLAGRILLVLTVTLGALPLLFWLAPSLAEHAVFGVPLAWLLLGVLVYPWLLFLGWRYVRAAERNEQHFSELLGDVER